MYSNAVPAAGIVTGIGRVMGRECVIIANDATVKGGTYFPMTVKKHLRAQEIAQTNRLPCIYLVDSGGAHLPSQDEVFADREHFGRIFYNQANMSALGIAQIAVVMGSCTAGGAYVPVPDETIIVKNQGTIFSLALRWSRRRPRNRHRGRIAQVASASGVADHLADNDAHALELARRAVGNLNGRKEVTLVVREPRDLCAIRRDLRRIPVNPRQPFDVREIVRIVTTRYSTSSRRATAPRSPALPHIAGYRLASSPTMACCFEAALRQYFIQLCSQRGIPPVFPQNITGFMVGRNEAGARQ
jgi:3-methylcrotonyl-CoA carboxylase beta subunit